MQSIPVYMYMKFPQFPIPASEGKDWKESFETVPEVTVVLLVPQQQEVGHEYGRYHPPRQQQFGQALRSNGPQLTALNNTTHQELITLSALLALQ